MIVPNLNYRANPARAIHVLGEIDRQLVQRLTPEILRLQGHGRDPITVYIDSEGGKIFYARALLDLLKASDQNRSKPCRITTVATGIAFSAAADMLCSGGYAMAYAECAILFHGVRRERKEITVAVASDMAETLRRTNERYAIALADKSVRRLGFRYAWLCSEFGNYRNKSGKQDLSDVECFIGMVLERLSEGGVNVVKRAQARNERYEALVSHVTRTVIRRKAFQNSRRTAETEALIIKSIVDFEKSKNKSDAWTYARGGLRQVMTDFLLIREYLSVYQGEPLTRLCDNWGFHFLSSAEQQELTAIQDETERQNAMREKVEDRVRPLWLFLVALCYALQEEDNDLTAIDAFWLGLIDEVIDGPPDLFPFRLLMEEQPDAPANQPPDPSAA